MPGESCICTGETTKPDRVKVKLYRRLGCRLSVLLKPLLKESREGENLADSVLITGYSPTLPDVKMTPRKPA